jgi:hypothetical protein
MKYLLPCLLSFCFFQCGEESVSEKINDLIVHQKADSMTKDFLKTAVRESVDSSGAWRSPVIVIKAKPLTEDYSSYKSIQLTYKNVSKKKVSAVKFKWYGVDAFGEPADVGHGIAEGIGGGFDDYGIRPGQTKIEKWSVYSSRVKKITSAYAFEVAYEDGTKWEFNK